MTKHELFVNIEEIGTRLDLFISIKLKITRSHSVKLIDDGNITIVNSNIKREKLGKSYSMRENDIITVQINDAYESKIEAQNLPLEIVYEDEELAVINKEKGVVVHPAPGNYSGTLVNALLYHMKDSLSGINGVARPGIVHRIDKDTSGLLLIAKTNIAHNSLSEQIKSHSAKRIYHAIICGNLTEDTGTVNRPIARNTKDRKKMAIVPNGREAITNYSVLERFQGFCYIEARLQTGRTHQIRVHMSSLGHPVFGDKTYGGKSCPRFEGQALHAKIIEFTHPKTNEPMCFEIPLPDYFIKELKNLNSEKV